MNPNPVKEECNPEKIVQRWIFSPQENKHWKVCTHFDTGKELNIKECGNCPMCLYVGNSDGSFQHCIAGSFQVGKNDRYTFPSPDNADLAKEICSPYLLKTFDKKKQRDWSFYGRVRYGTYPSDIKTGVYCPFDKDVAYCGPVNDQSYSVKVV